jgi:hypothetical protein
MRVFQSPECSTVQRLSNGLSNCWLFGEIRQWSETCMVDPFQLASLWNPCTTQSLVESQGSSKPVSNNKLPSEYLGRDTSACRFSLLYSSRSISVFVISPRIIFVKQNVDFQNTLNFVVLCETWGFHCGETVDFGPLDFNAMWTFEYISTFRRIIPLLSSGLPSATPVEIQPKIRNMYSYDVRLSNFKFFEIEIFIPSGKRI